MYTLAGHPPRTQVHQWLTASLLACRLAAGTRLTAGGALAVAGVAAPWLTTMAICQRRIAALAADRPVRASRAPAVLAAVVAGYALVGALIVVMRRD